MKSRDQMPSVHWRTWPEETKAAIEPEQMDDEDGQMLQLTVKVNASLRQAFINCCKGQDTTASREVRAFMRSYISEHGQH